MKIESVETDLIIIEPANVEFSIDSYLKVSYHDKTRGETLSDIEIKSMFPLSDSNKYLSITHDKKEIGMILDYTELDKDSRQIIEDVLEKNYFYPEIVKIFDIEDKYRLRFWTAITSHGNVEFYTRNRNDIVVNGNTVFIRDIDGNRYLIKNHTSLDKKSQKILNPEI